MKKEQTPKVAPFLFKQQSYDFVVEERLPFELTGSGDALYVFFEKQNQTTMDVINFLCAKLHISRLTLGIAGLKDKDAITQQWISIYKSALDKMGGERFFINTLSQVVRVIKADRHTRPLQMTDPIQNHFSIRLRASHKLGLSLKEHALQLVEEFFEDGFPNFFGTQRFGINGKNWEIGKQIVEKKTSIKDPFEAKFKLQAYSSWLFNQYLKERLPLGLENIEGDILVDGQATGPVRGYDTKVADPATIVGKLQQKFMQKHNINQKFFDFYKTFKLFGIPRPIWVHPTETRVKYQEDDLLLTFTLPSGSYASILIYQLLEDLGKIS